MKRETLRSAAAIICVVVGLATADCAPASEVNLDFAEATLNGKALDSLTLDSVTDLLGRPSHSTPASLSYANEGLFFVFRRQKLDFIKVFLIQTVRNFDPKDLQVLEFSPFAGQLPKGLSKNWKLGKFLEEFKQDGAVDKTDYAKISGDLKSVAEVKAQLTAPSNDAQGRRNCSQLIFLFEKEIRESYYGEMRLPRCVVKVIYDPDTKFLDSVEIYNERKVDNTVPSAGAAATPPAKHTAESPED